MLTHPRHSTQVRRLGYAQRAELCAHPVSRTLFNLMLSKQTNLTVSLDVTEKDELLKIAEQVGPHICVLKTHIDILEDFDDGVIPALQALSEKHGFLLFEDRKFADIGNTVRHQYEGGIYRIADWAHITNAHALPGPGLIDGLKEVGLPKCRALLLIAELSSKGNLTGGAYTQATIQLAQQHPDFVVGFITQHRVCDNPTSIHFTPGVKLNPGSEHLGQQWNTPQNAIVDRGADVIIVGRGIYRSGDPAGMAEQYRESGWSSYLEATAY